MSCLRRRVLIIGGSFSGLAAGRDLGSHYLVTIIDAKELVDFLWISSGFPMDFQWIPGACGFKSLENMAMPPFPLEEFVG